MRGRTNVLGFNEDLMNMSVEEYECAENITAGNMVTTYYEEKNTFSISDKIKGFFELSDERYIVFYLRSTNFSILNKKYNVYSKTLSDRKYTDQTGYECFSCYELGNDNFVIFNLQFALSNTKLNVTFLHYDIVSDLFEISQKSETLNSFVNSANSLNGDTFDFMRNNAINFITGITYGSSPANMAFIRIYFKITGNDISSFNISDVYGNKFDSSSVSNADYRYFSMSIKGIILDNGFLLSWGGYVTNVSKISTPTSMSRIAYFTDEFKTTLNSISFSSVYELNFISSKNDYIQIVYIKSIGEEYNRIYKRTFRVDNYSSLSVTWLNDETLIGTIDNDSTYKLSKSFSFKLDDDFVILQFWYLYKFNDYRSKSFLIEAISDTSVNVYESDLTYLFYIWYFNLLNKNDEILIQLTSVSPFGAAYSGGVGIREYELLEDTKELRTLVYGKNYVKNANDLLYIRGIAKESGKTGDTIEVYKPILP